MQIVVGSMSTDQRACKEAQMSNAVADPSTTKKEQGKPQPEGIGIAQLAKRLEADPRALRQWLRSEGKGLGQRGKRYSFTAKQADEIARGWKAAAQEASAE
jgi:phage antirepressor YoqD-like protein